MSGSGWDAVLAAANAADPAQATIADQDSNNNVEILAAGIVYARTGTQSYKDKVTSACARLVSIGHPNNRTLAAGREVGAYAMAADLVGYRTTAFENWLRDVAENYQYWDDDRYRTLRGMFEERPNNWGNMAFGSLCAIYRYLNDTANLQEIRDYWIQCMTGPKPAPVIFGTDLSWHADQSDLRWINPQGAVKQGVNIDGIIPDDMRRNGSFSNPPPSPSTDYHWEGQQGFVTGARILDRAGMPIYQAADQALYRASYILQVVYGSTYNSGWKAGGDDLWILKFQDHVYGTNWSGSQDIWGAGKIAGWAYVTLAD